MEYLEFFSKVFSSIGGLGFLIGLVILYKIGLLQFLVAWKKNGAGNNEEVESIKGEIKILEENHLHEIKDLLKDIKTNTDKEIFLLEDSRQILKELQNKLKL